MNFTTFRVVPESAPVWHDAPRREVHDAERRATLGRSPSSARMKGEWGTGLSSFAQLHFDLSLSISPGYEVHAVQLRPETDMCSWTICYALVFAAAFGSSSVAVADEIHRNDFSAKTTFFVKGAANVRVEEKGHDLSAERSRSLPTSEHIRLLLATGKNETNYAYYYYPTPAVPWSRT